MRPVLPSSEPFTADTDLLRSALSEAFVPAGRTALHDAIAQGLAYVARGTRPRHALVVLSDGGDNASATTFDAVLKQAQASNTVIYTVAVVDPAERSANPKRLRRLSSASGGLSFEPRDTGAVRRAFQQISGDIRHGYTLGFEPADSREPSRFHPLRVEARRPDGQRLTTRTRTGYLSGRAGHGP